MKIIKFYEKTYFSLIISCLCLLGGVAQGNSNSSPHWKINGNVSDTNKFIGTINTVPVIFKTNSIERLRLTPDGNLGLGIKNPQAKLDVNGFVKFRDGFQLPNLTEFSTTETPSYFLVMDASGNVYKKVLGPFPVADPGPMPSPSICDLANPDGTIGIQNPQWNSGLNKLYSRCEDVFVGIGTAAPRVNLEVNGTTYTRRLVIGSIDPTTASGNIFHLKAYNTNPANSQNILLIENYQRKLMQLNNQGLLQVREVNIDIASWPDYVFESGYKLMPLKEVEQFIIENKHLPKVPEAKTIVEGGVNLGEMNTILMEKVEELTLYLIEQEKTMEALKIQVSKLELNQKQGE